MRCRNTTTPGESTRVGAAEVASRLGVRPQTVHTWRQRQLMPEPRWTVSGQPAWDWVEIEAWARRTGRLREADIYAALLELQGVGWEGNLDELRSDRVPQRLRRRNPRWGEDSEGGRSTPPRKHRGVQR